MQTVEAGWQVWLNMAVNSVCSSGISRETPGSSAGKFTTGSVGEMT